MLAPSAQPKNNPSKTLSANSLHELRANVASMTPELLGRALRMTGSADVAEDIVQDTVERALRFENQYRLGTNLRAWVHQILFSVFITKVRRNRRERRIMGSIAHDPNLWTALPPVAPELASLSKRTRAALDSIPAQFSEAVMLIDVEEVPYKDAADMLGVPVGTMMSRIHRGRRMLADELASERTVSLRTA